MGGGGGGESGEGGAGAESANEEDTPEEKPVLLVTYERVGREVLMPRPVVSMHVEEQAGSGADGVLRLLLLGDRLRQQDPGLRYVWLSAEKLAMPPSQLVSMFSRPHLQSSWLFLQPTTTALQETDAVAASFSSLLIASECDYLAGALTSRWSQIIHTLRSTNGRLYSGFVSS
ncbi:hypothetical protein CLOM_g8432 [Closterium sp. NIES-68]|nr:hypothetical protein CLOM_g8432 [Closterium sp. NIES-68]